LLALFAAFCTLARPVKIETSMFCRTSAFSTLAQFGVVGTNQLYFAAFANGASCGFDALIEASVVVFGITFPCVASERCALVEVNALIQSAPSDTFWLVIGIARSDPPRKLGMYLPAMWLGIGYAPIAGASAGLPSFGSSAYGHSQPLPMNDATLPFAKTSACCGFASSPVLFARDWAATVALSAFRPAIEALELSAPCHLPPLWTAILPPKS